MVHPKTSHPAHALKLERESASFSARGFSDETVRPGLGLPAAAVSHRFGAVAAQPPVSAPPSPGAVVQLSGKGPGKNNKKQQKQKAAAKARKQNDQSKADRSLIKAAKYSGDMIKKASKTKTDEQIKQKTKNLKGHASKNATKKQNKATKDALKNIAQQLSGKDVEDRLRRKDDDQDQGGAGGGFAIEV